MLVLATSNASLIPILLTQFPVSLLLPQRYHVYLNMKVACSILGESQETGILEGGLHGCLICISIQD